MITADPVVIFGIIVILLCIVLIIFGLVTLTLLEKVKRIDKVLGDHLDQGDPHVSTK